MPHELEKLDAFTEWTDALITGKIPKTFKYFADQLDLILQEIKYDIRHHRKQCACEQCRVFRKLWDLSDEMRAVKWKHE